MPAGGRVVLWAHNGHVFTSSSATMGRALRQMVADSMVVMGFPFAQGTWNAIGTSVSTYTGLWTHPTDSYYYPARLPAEYDAIIFLDRTTPSVLLPFKYPQSF